MNPRTRSILAWMLSAIIVIATLFTVGSDLVQGTIQGNTGDNLIKQAGDLLWKLLPIEFAILAALLVSNQPRNSLGSLLMIPAVTSVLAWFADRSLSQISEATSPGPPQIMALWFSGWSWLPVIFSILLVPLLFPTGRPPSPRWRWVIYLALTMCVVFTFLTLFVDVMQHPTKSELRFANPIGFIPSGPLESNLFMVPWSIGLGVLTLGSVAALFVRYRRAAAVERQQIKWLLYACGLFAAVYVPGLPLEGLNNGLVGYVVNLLFALAILLIPVAIGIAILRYRLFDIDLIIRKTLVYAALSAFLALVYFGVVVLLQQVFRSATGETSAVAIVLSTLAIAALFSPLRRRVQDFVDRRFYRRKYDAQRVLAQFAKVAREETDLDALSGALEHAVQETIQPAKTDVWLRPADGKRT